jgi:hypothetical protein
MINFKIEYGYSRFVDITRLLSNFIINQKIIFIPFGDHNRSSMFGCDPCVGITKVIKIECFKNNNIQFFNSKDNIYIDIIENNLYTDLTCPAYILDIVNLHTIENINNKKSKKESFHEKNNKYLNNFIFPITFSIPECKIIKTIPEKNKLISDLIPGVLSTYIYNNENDYYKEYMSSIFSTTTRKGGWDCLRHYEILACGSIPYFPFLEDCPDNTLSLLPKDLIIEGNLLFIKLKNKKFNDLNNTELEECNMLSTKLLKYTIDNLTTKKMAQYILNKINIVNIKNLKILYLSGDTNPDYLSCLNLIGFKELIGSNCHDYPKINYIYKNQNIDYTKLYGKGITYSNIIDSTLHKNDFDTNIQNDILNKYYDIVIYGNYHRGMPFLDIVDKVYKPNEIVLICGEDAHPCNYNIFLDKGYYLFIREFYDYP